MRKLNPPSVKLLFDRKKVATAFKKGAIEIEVYYNNERIRVNTGINVLKTQWFDDMVVEHPDAMRLNSHIRKLHEDIMEMLRIMGIEGEYNLSLLKSASFCAKASKHTFLEYLQERIEKHPMRDSTRKHHRVMLNVLKQYGKIVYFTDLTRPNIMMFDDYLHTLGIKQMTIHSYHKRLKPYVKEAMLMGFIRKNPYEGVTIQCGKASVIKYLTKEERRKIQELELSSYYDKVRDLFIFSSFTGLAFSDMIKIKKSDFFEEDGELFIEDTRIKSATRYKLMILPPAKDILEKYNYNLNLMSNQKANMYLKAIGVMAGIKHNLTMHMARHTFATWALSEGIPIETVSKMLAHTNIKQTQVYANVLQTSVNKGFTFLKDKL